MVESERATPQRRAQSSHRHTICGGVQLFIDLQRAFDSVDRHRLFQRLESLGVSVQLAKLLNEWHRDSQYLVHVAGTTQPTSIFRGVRQGCKAAPWLWNCLLCMMLEDLAQHIPADWLRAHLNLYADDGHASDTFTSETELQTTLKRFGWILHVLQQYGLTINQSKSVILITLGGKNGRRRRASLTHWQNDTEWISFDGPAQTFCIPIAQRTTYLGAIMSYQRNMMELTVKHRIQVAHAAFGRLSKFLTGRKGLTPHDKITLWKTCILSVLTYGILPVGLNSKCVHMLQTTIFVMVRKILRTHAFYTGLSNFEAFRQHRVPLPVDLLWAAADTLQRSVTERRLHLESTDIVHTLDWSHLESLKNQLQLSATAGSVTTPVVLSQPEADASVLFCNICGFAVHDVSALRRHFTVAHAHSTYRTRHVQPADFSQYGMPHCKYCNSSFSTWRSFQNHIQRGCQELCKDPTASRGRHIVDSVLAMPAFPERPAKLDAVMRGPKPLSSADLQNLQQQEWGRRVLVIIGHRHWHHLRLESAANEYLSKRCCLCDQWVGRAQEMHKHMRLFHGEFWPNVMTKSTQLSNQYADEAPCHFCKCVFQRTHSCNVWTQVAMLLLGGAGITEAVSCDPAGPLICDICNAEQPSIDAMHFHLATEHKLNRASWNVGRDAKDGQPICAHCNMVFQTLESLRSHIVQGRCSGYNPLLSSEPSPVKEQWRSALCEGALLSTLKDPKVRMTLTLHCQCCTQRYSRAGDLALHLQSAHSEL